MSSYVAPLLHFQVSEWECHGSNTQLRIIHAIPGHCHNLILLLDTDDGVVSAWRQNTAQWCEHVLSTSAEMDCV